MAITLDDVNRAIDGDSEDFSILEETSPQVLFGLDVKLSRLGRFSNGARIRDFEAVDIIRDPDEFNAPSSAAGVQLQTVFKHKKSGNVGVFLSFYADSYSTAVEIAKLAR